MITSMLPSVGARFCISQPPPRDVLDCWPNPTGPSPDSSPPAGAFALPRLPTELVVPFRIPALAQAAFVGGFNRPTIRLTVWLTSAAPLRIGATSQFR